MTRGTAQLPVLNVIGAGKVGMTLARLLRDAGQVTLGSLFSRDIDNARSAVQFAGDGEAVDEFDNLRPADLWLLSVPDGAIATAASRLAGTPFPWRDRRVFHCSGLHSSALLEPLARQGALVASLHPAHSFANPGASLTDFASTLCTVEGAATLCGRLTDLFEALGAKVIAINPESKALYHCANTVASNYLVSLMATSLELLQAADIGESDGRAILAPLVRQTLDNIFNFGPEAALTGPIARADVNTVKAHLDALSTSDAHLQATLYRMLGRITVTIANRATPERADDRLAIENLFREQR
ncbi:MAG: hypothetical protein CMK32_15380 [Porticoccaceae bacterium]|nr:hypothetical protein [Porticoccaceae bacterium]